MIPNRFNQGFSLIELVVAMVLGLLVFLVIGQVQALFGSRAKTTSSTADSQTNGATALYIVERDVRMAGYGFAVQSALGCNIKANYKGTKKNFALAPVMLTNGADGAPDSIQIMMSTKEQFTVPAKIDQTIGVPASNWHVNSTVGMSKDDFIIAQNGSETDCPMIQVTNTNDGGEKILVHNSGHSDWNPTGNDAKDLFGDAIEKGTTLFNLGSLIQRTYAIDNNELRETLFVSATNGTQTETVASKIVQLQAEYGKDTDADGSVDLWDTATPATNAGWRQILAIHVVLLSQSDQRENSEVTTVLPTWFSYENGDNESFNLDNVDEWKRYRYRIFDSIVPVRNVIWSQP